MREITIADGFRDIGSGHLVNAADAMQQYGVRCAMRDFPGIERRPGKCGGRPTLVGTRIEPKNIFALHEGGWSDEKIVSDAYPHLTLEQVKTAIEFVKAERWLKRSSRKSLMIANEPGGYHCFCLGCGFEDHIRLGEGLPIPAFTAWATEIRRRHDPVHRRAREEHEAPKPEREERPET